MMTVLCAIDAPQIQPISDESCCYINGQSSSECAEVGGFRINGMWTVTLLLLYAI
jgi:hypothetical protein